MKPRLIIALLCAGALAFACGPRSRTELPPATADAMPASPALVSIGAVASVAPKAVSSGHSRKHDAEPKALPKIDSRLNVAFEHNGGVRLALNVRNVGQRHVELLFPTGQSYDFAIMDSTGREVWRWSRDRMFTTGVQNKELGTGDTMELAETWAHAKPGRYTAVATLKSTNFPVEQHVDFVMH